MKVEGKVAIVTGGASGLGEAAVLRLVQEGCKVVIADVQEELAKKLVQTLGEDKTVFIKTDVTDEESVQNMINQTVQKYGGIHIVVNSAGIARQASILSKKCTAEDFKKVLLVNVVGTFNVAKAAAIVMVKQPTLNDKGERGVIINIASVVGIEGQNGFTVYGGSKGAVIGMTLPLARDLGKFGIRVVALAPSLFLTSMGNQIDKKLHEYVKRTVPLGRLGDPAEFAELCVTVCNNSYLTGSVIRLDGGQTLGHISL
jgi:NAD(P)-dependent dehydrogenase (short-subunit alcohol dehydrogenase family)